MCRSAGCLPLRLLEATEGLALPAASNLPRLSGPSLVLEGSQGNTPKHPHRRKPTAGVTAAGEPCAGGRCRGGRENKGAGLRREVCGPAPAQGFRGGSPRCFPGNLLGERRLDDKGPFQPWPVTNQILGPNVFKVSAPFPLSRGSPEPTCAHRPRACSPQTRHCRWGRRDIIIASLRE